jgi:hypothetical protein
MSETNISDRIIKNIKITTIEHSSLILLINGIIQVEYISAYQCVIPLHNQREFPHLAMISDGIINIEGWLTILFISYDLESLFGD